MATILGSLFEDEAIFIDLFVPLRGWFVCLNSSQKRFSPALLGNAE